MEPIFAFSPEKEVEETVKKTWNEFKSKLPSILTLEQAKEIIFLHVFDDIFENNGAKKYYTKKLGDLDYYFLRAANLHEQRNVSLDRFIPNSKFISDDNRFSPPGIEWIYLGISKNKRRAGRCCINECHAKVGDYFGLCEFEINTDFSDAPIVDLTVGMPKTYDEINDELNNSAQEEIEKSALTFLATGDKNYLKTDLDFTKNIILQWYVQIDTKMMSEQLFIPVEESEKGKEYLPFQWLAKYFLSLGFKGIIYKSAVYPIGKNLVLFDKSMVIPKTKKEFYIKA